MKDFPVIDIEKTFEKKNSTLIYGKAIIPLGIWWNEMEHNGTEWEEGNGLEGSRIE